MSVATSNGREVTPLPTSDVFDDLSALAGKAQAHLDQLDAHRANLIERHRQEMAAIEAERTRLRGLLRVIDPQPKAKSPKPQKRQTTYDGRGVSPELCMEVAGAILKLDREEFTVREIISAMGRDPKKATHLYAGINALRDIEFLGKAGKRGSAQLWSILDPTTLGRLRATNG